MGGLFSPSPLEEGATDRERRIAAALADLAPCPDPSAAELVPAGFSINSPKGVIATSPRM